MIQDQITITEEPTPFELLEAAWPRARRIAALLDRPVEESWADPSTELGEAGRGVPLIPLDREVSVLINVEPGSTPADSLCFGLPGNWVVALDDAEETDHYTLPLDADEADLIAWLSLWVEDDKEALMGIKDLGGFDDALTDERRRALHLGHWALRRVLSVEIEEAFSGRSSDLIDIVYNMNESDEAALKAAQELVESVAALGYVLPYSDPAQEVLAEHGIEVVAHDDHLTVIGPSVVHLWCGHGLGSIIVGASKRVDMGCSTRKDEADDQVWIHSDNGIFVAPGDIEVTLDTDGYVEVDDEAPQWWFSDDTSGHEVLPSACAALVKALVHVGDL